MPAQRPGDPLAGGAHDAAVAPPLHRVASGWAVSTLLGALILGAVCAVFDVAFLISVHAEELAGAVALGATLEGLAAVARRLGRRAAWLLLLAPPLGLLLALVAVAWLQAYAPGAPQVTFEQFGARLTRSLSRLTPGALGSVALLLAPLAWARVTRPRLWVACAASAAGPGALCVILTALQRGCVVFVTPETSALLVLCVLGETLGLHLGDRLEPRLAGWLRWRLHGASAAASA